MGMSEVLGDLVNTSKSPWGVQFRLFVDSLLQVQTPLLVALLLAFALLTPLSSLKL